jgi:hypothetical protein
MGVRLHLCQVFDLRTGTSQGVSRAQVLKRQWRQGTMCGNVAHRYHLLKGYGEGPPQYIPGCGPGECPWQSSRAFQEANFEAGIENKAECWTYALQQFIPDVPGPLRGNAMLTNQAAANFETLSSIVAETGATSEGTYHGSNAEAPRWQLAGATWCRHVHKLQWGIQTGLPTAVSRSYFVEFQGKAAITSTSLSEAKSATLQGRPSSHSRSA